MSKQLTEQYIAAFSARNLAAIDAMMTEDFAIEDPVIKRIEGKARALGMMQELFASCYSLSFSAKHIFVDGSTTLIEFTLDMDQAHLTGVDIIEWRDGKMAELRAYLDIPKA